jgi:hypothetical protein
MEHFCTLFDYNFLPFGMTLWRSLEAQHEPYQLWVLCMDEKVEELLLHLNLANMKFIPLREIETAELLSIKPSRSVGEYCWTLTPFIFGAVFDRALDAQRVTYLDSDLYFFDKPSLLLSELSNTGKSVLITEHAYDPAYDLSAESGRFCVQFNTFTRDPASLEVNEWWKQRCLEWCFARYEDGKFGDQKYLDCWPDKFGDTVHVLQKKEGTLAPWNVKHFHRLLGESLKPVFFHFHGFRPIGFDRAQMYLGYRVGAFGNKLYDAYLLAFSQTWRELAAMGYRSNLPHASTSWLGSLVNFLRIIIKRNRRYGRL